MLPPDQSMMLVLVAFAVVSLAWVVIDWLAQRELRKRDRDG